MKEGTKTVTYLWVTIITSIITYNQLRYHDFKTGIFLYASVGIMAFLLMDIREKLNRTS